MKTFVGSCILMCLLLAGTVDAAEKIRVLVVTGGHPFDEAGFHEMFAAFPDLACDWAKFPEAWDQMTPALAEKYDVLVLYDMWQKELTDQQKADFKALYGSGIGVFALHHDLCAHVNWGDYYDMAGARIFYKETVFRGQKCPASSFRAGRDIPVHVVDANHPVTLGMKDFVIHDEAYGNFLVHPEVQVLLESDHPEQTRQTAWVWHYGKSTVLGLLLGHDRMVYENANFRQLIHNGIRFLAENSKNTQGDEEGDKE